MLEGELNKSVTAIDTKLGADVVTVIFDGAHADTQFIGDLTARHVLRNHRKYTSFSGRE